MVRVRRFWWRCSCISTGRLELLVTAACALNPFRVMLMATAFVGAAHGWPAGTVSVTEPAAHFTGAAGAGAAGHCLAVRN